MFCTNCGFRLEDGDEFCPNCGQKVDAVEGFAEREMFYDNPQPRDMYNPEELLKKQSGNDAENTITKYIIATTGGIGLAWVAIAALRLVSLAVDLVCRIIPFSAYIQPINEVIRLIYNVLNYLRISLVWALIIIPVVVIGGLIYLLAGRRYANSKQMILVGIIDSALVLLAAILFLVKPGYGHGSAYVIVKVFMYISALVSIVLGIDLFLNVFVEKKSLRGKFNLSDDFAIIKDKMSKPSVVVDASHYTDKNIPQYELTVQHEAKDSFFDGSGGGLFAKWLLLSLVSIVTCGLAAPIMIHRVIKWKVEHNVIEGKRLAFNGTAGQLYLLIIKWLFLTAITCGIYCYLEFPILGYYNWVGSHTAFEDSQNVNQNGEFVDSFFDGNIAETIGYVQLFRIITLFTCGIGLPWGQAMLSRWEKKSSVINRRRLFFDGDGGSLFREYIMVWILTLITCGIYLPWGYCKIQRYIMNHTHIDSRWSM